MKVHPITNFFYPERMKKGDLLKLSETDYLYISDTVRVPNVIRQWESFCRPKCILCPFKDEKGITYYCRAFIAKYMNERTKQRTRLNFCIGHFYVKKIPMMHIYKFVKGGL